MQETKIKRESVLFLLKSNTNLKNSQTHIFLIIKDTSQMLGQNIFMNRQALRLRKIYITAFQVISKKN